MFSFPGKRLGASLPDPRPTSPALVLRWAAMEAVARSQPTRQRFVVAPDASSKEIMRSILIGLAVFSTFGLLFAACSQDTTSAATSTSGTGGAPNCDGVYLDLSDKDGGYPCSVCAHANCCAELAACRDHACLVCANYTGGPGCGPESVKLEDCANSLCLPTCSPGVEPRDK